MRVKALTVWQPWASLIAHGVKEYETRAWQTKYRGPLAIHASVRWGRDQQEVVGWRPYPDLLAALGLSVADLPKGFVVGVVDLVDVIPTQDVAPLLSESERRVGDYRPGRFAWRLENARLLPEPVYAKGAQSLWWWNVPRGLEKKLGLEVAA